MPLVEIHSLPPPEGVSVVDVLAAVNRDVAAALGCRPDAVWSTWRLLGEGEYFVGPDPGRGPIVHVWINRPPDAVERCVEAIEIALRSTLGEDAEPFVTTSLVQGAPAS